MLSSQTALKSLPESDLHYVLNTAYTSVWWITDQSDLLKAEVFFYSIVIYISLHGKIDE